MNYENIRNDLYTKAGNKRDLEQAKAKAAYEAVQKAHEAYLDGVDAAIGAIERLSQETPVASPDRDIAPEDVPQEGLCRARCVMEGYISPARLKAAIEENLLDKVIRPFDEIDIPLDSGETVTVVCGYSDSNMARFVFKDCWDEHCMNQENTNKTGYYGSDARKHVLEDIYPHLPQAWKDIIKPRLISEVIDEERVHYADFLWLPSATDVFGPPENEWRPVESDSFQLPIFKKERNRVKELGKNGTFPWWLRTGRAEGPMLFCYYYVDASGAANCYGACYSLGFAPGFDI